MTPVPKAILRGALLLAPLALLAWTHDAAARPGGGQSYSGGGSSSSSRSSSSNSSRSSSSSSNYRPSYGGSSPSYSGGNSYASDNSNSRGGSGDWVMPTATIGLFFLFGAAGFLHQREQAMEFDTTSGPTPKRRQSSLSDIHASDPEFSTVLFEDFVYALYARAHAARSDPQEMAALASYIRDDARTALLARGPTGVKIHGVIIGKMEVIEVTIGSQVCVRIDFETNYTAELPDGPQGYYVSERWTLKRALGVVSRPPTDVYSFQCPSCGGPYERGDQGRCSRCGQQVEGGRFDWWLADVRVLEQRETPPTLTGEVAEQGTHNPSVLAPGIGRRYAKFTQQDPSAGQPALERRVREIHTALNAAYTAGDLRPVRPHVSDSLYNFLSYWTDAYRAQGLRNVLEDAEMSRIQIVKLTRDRHYDAITARIWARSIDYTITLADRHRVSGDPTTPRAYSEYWTLIRGAQVRGAPRTPGVCPNCGAPLDRVNMAGNCEACGTHLTRGEFDWVLSKIEQDDSYTG